METVLDEEVNLENLGPKPIKYEKKFLVKPSRAVLFYFKVQQASAQSIYIYTLDDKAIHTPQENRW